MKVRHAKSSDLNALLRVEQSGDVHWGKKGLEQALKDPHIQLLVAVDDDETISGFIAALVVAEEMQVQNVVISEQYRRQGIGTLLLEAAMARAKSKRATDVFLEVAANNQAALALYKKLGFEQIGMRPNFYRNGADAIIMQNKM